MLLTLIRSLLVLVLLGALSHAEAAGRRVALVIGNSAYVSVPELDNPSNDAKAVAQQLRDLGFEVTLLLDLDKASFEARVRDFAGSLNGAEAAVFFHAGHGLQRPCIAFQSAMEPPGARVLRLGAADRKSQDHRADRR
jgi:hypothetical protein